MGDLLLSINKCIEFFTDETKPIVERLLWIDPSGLLMAFIDINNKKALPFIRKRVEVNESLETGEARILPTDPFEYLARQVLSEASIEKRDKDYKLIYPLISRNDGAIFISVSRGKLIANRAKEVVNNGKETHKMTIYFQLRRYFQRGQRKYALNPEYKECGHKGKNRIETVTENSPKRGHPKESNDPNEPPGININKELLDKMKRGFRLFLNTRRKRSVDDAYYRTLWRIFNVSYKYENGVLVPDGSIDKVPSIDQFRYWYLKIYNRDTRIKSREGEHEYQLNHRASLKSEYFVEIGPGRFIEIDAAFLPIGLVSKVNRNSIIGMITFYSAYDMATGLIVGILFTTLPPCWEAVGLLLENIAKNKVEYCREYGIEILEEEWPVDEGYVPDGIYHDRSELFSPKSDILVDSPLDIQLTSTPPGRGDLKGIVEGNHKSWKDKVINGLEGEIKHENIPGQKDERLLAIYNLDEITEVGINNVLRFNFSHKMDGYPLTEEMIGNDVMPFPIDIYNWAKPDIGQLKKFEMDTIILNLYPPGEAKVTGDGIKFRDLYYLCPLATREGWYTNADKKNRIKRIVYHPSNPAHIYLRLEDGKGFEKCYLHPRSKGFENYTWEEIVEHFRKRKAQSHNRKMAANARYYDAEAAVKKRAMQDKKMTPANGKSKAARINDIPENKKTEQGFERANRSVPSNWNESQNESSKETVVADDERVPLPTNIDRMKKKLEDRVNNVN